MVNAHPYGDRVVIEPIEESEKVGSIYLPDASRERPSRGRVLAVGEGLQLDNGDRIPMSTKVGDVVVFSAYSGQDLKLNGRAVKVIQERDLLLKLTGEGADPEEADEEVEAPAVGSRAR